VPRRRSGGGGGGRQAAKDAFGQPIKAAEWLATRQPGDRQLTQGLQARRGARVVRARGDAAHSATGVVAVRVTAAAAGTALAAAARSVAKRCAVASRPAAARAVVCATASQLMRAATTHPRCVAT
jgi:hypothetical protein